MVNVHIISILIYVLNISSLSSVTQFITIQVTGSKVRNVVPKHEEGGWGARLRKTSQTAEATKHLQTANQTFHAVVWLLGNDDTSSLHVCFEIDGG